MTNFFTPSKLKSDYVTGDIYGRFLKEEIKGGREETKEIKVWVPFFCSQPLPIAKKATKGVFF